MIGKTPNSILRRALVMSLPLVVVVVVVSWNAAWIMKQFLAAAPSSWLLNCARQFRLIHPERFCSFRQEPETAYKILYSLLFFQHQIHFVIRHLKAALALSPSYRAPCAKWAVR